MTTSFSQSPSDTELPPSVSELPAEQSARYRRLPNLRVLIASPYIFGVGGVAVAISCISREMVNRGVVVTHLTRGPGLLVRRLCQDTSHPTYAVHFRYPIPTLKSWLGFWLILPIHCLNIARFLIRHKIDHVLIQYPMPAHLALAMACRLLGIQLCVTFQGSDAHRLQSLTPQESTHLRCLLRLACAVTAVSESLADKVVAFFPALSKGSITIIPNGTPLVLSSSRRAAPYSGKLRITAVGKLIPRKGFDVLIRAIGLLKAQADIIDCQIIGEGPDLEELENLIVELDVEDTVKLVGSMDHHCVLEELQASDIFVLSSRAEGAALVLAEAMASGCAVISTAVDGALETIASGENGLLVSVDSPEQLAAALHELLFNHELRLKLAENGIASSRELLWDRITDRYLQVMRAGK